MRGGVHAKANRDPGPDYWKRRLNGTTSKARVCRTTADRPTPRNSSIACSPIRGLVFTCLMLTVATLTWKGRVGDAWPVSSTPSLAARLLYYAYRQTDRSVSHGSPKRHTI
ncbi:hypothetical protein CIB48_g4610 [Xylaria polymorpha]|nr:hypothetical protein CIB48_g4610 [Xylaria polymorpha]